MLRKTFRNRFVARKPVIREDEPFSAYCPRCNSEVNTHFIHGGIYYCECCGQAINWEGVECSVAV